MPGRPFKVTVADSCSLNGQPTDTDDIPDDNSCGSMFWNCVVATLQTFGI